MTGQGGAGEGWGSAVRHDMMSVNSHVLDEEVNTPTVARLFEKLLAATSRARAEAIRTSIATIRNRPATTWQSGPETMQSGPCDPAIGPEQRD